MAVSVAAGGTACDNIAVADNKNHYIDPGWPPVEGDDHAVSELVADRTGSLSPFGTLTFPLPADEVPYIHPVTVVNR